MFKNEPKKLIKNAMSKNNEKIPVYSLNSFRVEDQKNSLFQVELFDANRHFQVAYPHRHDFYEILFLVQGSGYHIIDSNQYEIKPPCIFFLSPGQAHKLNLSKDVEGFIFLFTSEFYALFNSNKNKLLEFPFFFSVEQSNPPLYISNAQDAQFISQLFERGCFAMQNKLQLSDEIIHALLELLLLTCNQLYTNERQIEKQNKSHILVKRFLIALEENYLANCSIDFYANMLAITPNHLTQIVKQITGKTTISIIQEKRIIEIKRMLLHSSLSISQIAEHLNFTDVSYFTKYFKKGTGITPNQYRQKEQQKFC